METIDEMMLRPCLGRDEVHVWQVRLPDMLDRVDELLILLNEKEQKKANRFLRKSDRHSSIVARGALRMLLSGYTGLLPEDLVFNYSETGKPYIKNSDVSFNISHSAEWILLAFGLNGTLGVDIEKIRSSLDVVSIADRYFSREEVDLIRASKDQTALFFQLWAYKEACVKARGSTLFRELGEFSVPIMKDRLSDQGESNGWFFQRLDVDSAYAAAVVTNRPGARISCYHF